MKLDLAAAMRRAGARLCVGDALGGTRIRQDALYGRGAPEDEPAPSTGPDGTGPSADPVERSNDTPAEPAEPAHAPDGVVRPEPGEAAPRPRRPLGVTLRLLEEGRAAVFPQPLLRRQMRAPEVPEGARFETRAFDCPEGSRNYRLYVPGRVEEGLRGLLVMLHGCKQNADDFAAGTGMNAHAERERLLVAYPCQGTAQNALGCWNWFNPDNQRRDAGEPAIITGIARSLLKEFPVPRNRVMAAGLSAGGSMAAVLGATYPDVFAAIGIHSGLPYGMARDVASAFAVMRGELGDAPETPPSCPTIVFHGDADRTVHPGNPVRLLRAARSGDIRREVGTSPGGRPYRVEILSDPRGAPRLELWMVEGAGHAWSGGDPAGSYTDPDGPDASAELVRFLFSQP